MTRKEMEFIIECLKRYQNYITDDCRMQMYDIKRDEGVLEQWIMSAKLIRDMKTQIKKQKRKN
tara:strand:- start:456 stop:644 length:189 start_codon:yes stop_codon:yes gene_type:complete